MDVGASDVQAVGIAEDVGVAVRGADQEQDALTGAHLDPIEFRVLTDPSLYELDRQIEAQQFLDSVLSEFGLGSQPLEAIAVPEQCEKTVADQVEGRLVTGAKKQRYVRNQLGFAQPAALLLRGDSRERRSSRGWWRRSSICGWMYR